MLRILWILYDVHTVDFTVSHCLAGVMFFINYVVLVSFFFDKWELTVTLKAETSTLMLEQKSLYNLMHSLHLIQLIHSTYLHFTSDLSCSSQSHALLNTVFCVHTYLTSDNSGGERGRHWSLKQARRLMRIGKCDVIHSLLICQSSTNHFHGAFSVSSYTSEDTHASLWAACASFLGKQPDVLNFPYICYHCWASITEPCYRLMLCVNRRGNPWYVPHCAFFHLWVGNLRVVSNSWWLHYFFFFLSHSDNSHPSSHGNINIQTSILSFMFLLSELATFFFLSVLPHIL